MQALDFGEYRAWFSHSNITPRMPHGESIRCIDHVCPEGQHGHGQRIVTDSDTANMPYILLEMLGQTGAGILNKPKHVVMFDGQYRGKVSAVPQAGDRLQINAELQPSKGDDKGRGGSVEMKCINVATRDATVEILFDFLLIPGRALNMTLAPVRELVGLSLDPHLSLQQEVVHFYHPDSVKVCRDSCLTGSYKVTDGSCYDHFDASESKKHVQILPLFGELQVGHNIARMSIARMIPGADIALKGLFWGTVHSAAVPGNSLQYSVQCKVDRADRSGMYRIEVRHVDGSVVLEHTAEFRLVASVPSLIKPVAAVHERALAAV